MKNALIICLSLLFISGPKQINAPAPAYLHLYWIKKVKKELLRTVPGASAQQVDGPSHFTAAECLVKLMPFLDK